MKILIVEDEDGLRDALKVELETAGFTADTAACGSTGLDMLLSGIYDIALLDVMLPEINGFDILKKVGSENISTPIIMLTAKSELDDKVTGLDLGSDDYITKPFEFKELLARIRMVIRRKNKETVDNNIHFKDLTLNTSARKISNDNLNETLELTGKEYDLLEYFMTNTGHVMTREMITEKIWGYDSEAEYNNVDVYVSFLRKKLSHINSCVLIKSVRGVGYVME